MRIKIAESGRSISKIPTSPYKAPIIRTGAEGRELATVLGPAHPCVVPFNSFSEFNKAEGGDVWFALAETPPMLCFASIWTNWTSVRKVKEGETTNDLYALLKTEPNAEVETIYPKAMPVILTTQGSRDLDDRTGRGGSEAAAAPPWRDASPAASRKIRPPPKSVAVFALLELVHDR